MIFKALDFYQHLLAQGYLFDQFTYGTLINGLSKNGQLKAALHLLQEMEESSDQPNLVMYSALIDGLCKD